MFKTNAFLDSLDRCHLFKYLKYRPTVRVLSLRSSVIHGFVTEP